MEKDAIYVTYGENALEMGRELLRASGATRFFKPGKSVSVKPNLVVAKPASSGATTHVGFAEAVLEAARDFGVTDLRITESSWVGDYTEHAFIAEGYDRLAKRFNAKLIDLKKDDGVPVEFAGETVLVCRSIVETDVLVNLPVLKAHAQMRMTCAVKNFHGCVPDSEKRRFHSEGLARHLALYPGLIKSAFTMVDGICGDLSFEEGGTPVPMNRAILGCDPLRVDAYAARLLGMALHELPYLTMAERHGVGSLAADTIIETNRPEKVPADLNDMDGFARFRRLTSAVSADNACSACYGSLVHALNRIDFDRTPLQGPISIGQGFRDQSGDGMGIGNCCGGFDRCVTGCPPEARAIIDALLAK